MAHSVHILPLSPWEGHNGPLMTTARNHTLWTSNILTMPIILLLFWKDSTPGPAQVWHTTSVLGNVDIPLSSSSCTGSDMKVGHLATFAHINDHWMKKDRVNKTKTRRVNNWILLCWPVLYPQITGEPSLPGELIVNVSVKQSPIAEAIFRASPVVLAVPNTCVAMEWVWN